MRSRKRLLLSNQAAVYHVMSRTAYRSLLFGDEEKEIFTRMLFQQAVFAGVDVLGYCVMGNHIHLLLRVVPVDSLPDDVLLGRYRQYYGSQKTPQSTYSVEGLEQILRDGGSEADKARRRVIARMGDLPAFMRELKQRFTIWYNHKHANVGTIWAARYKSLLVEDSPESLTRIAAYLDLNPVRAKLVGDPKNYRWCGYAAALGGNRLMRSAVIQLFGQKLDFAEALKSYRIILYGKGYLSKSAGNSGSADSGTISAEKLEEVLQRGGQVPLHEFLRMRVRYFADGCVLGSKSFVESVFREHRDLFGTKRKKAGKALPGSAWGQLHSMRDLKKRVYS
ncbi:MAG: transposase [Puniceicoccaceae bacterium]|nr:MAG: transposase [Puniceicoccaceae bacterium]